MDQITQIRDSRTNVDIIFDHLYDEIASLRLLPGTKLSEADVAARFGVSRQPVRDAFSRLENLDLLLIRRQKATEVRRFSLQAIAKTRFIRSAVEAEVLRRAARECGVADGELLDAALEQQRAALLALDHIAFGKLDYEFHRTLCEIAEVDFAFDVISAEKAKVDRLCLLGLSKQDRMPKLLADHEAIAAKVKAGDGEGAVEVGMAHLARLDDTIAAITQQHSNYFEA
ncbi:GntR family transcriptional regulator [Celeribacter sp.]|uniref:GntR family transcriptional regulator n=1 Tax=Celeribacter sp. TaxID=1890673 RepID=UPI003A8F955A